MRSYALIMIFCLHTSKSKAESGNCLDKFIDDIVTPMDMCFDHVVDLLGEVNEFMKSTKKKSINCIVTEPYSHL